MSLRNTRGGSLVDWGDQLDYDFDIPGPRPIIVQDPWGGYRMRDGHQDVLIDSAVDKLVAEVDRVVRMFEDPEFLAGFLTRGIEEWIAAGGQESEIVEALRGVDIEGFSVDEAIDRANASQGDGEVFDQFRSFVSGVVSYPVDVGRAIVTGGSFACEGFSAACASNVEDARRIGRAIHEFQTNPEVQSQVELANQLATQIILSDPIIQSRVAGRGTTAVIVGTLGPVGMGLNTLALTGGALRASDVAGSAANVNTLVRGAAGMVP